MYARVGSTTCSVLWSKTKVIAMNVLCEPFAVSRMGEPVREKLELEKTIITFTHFNWNKKKFSPGLL